MRVCQSRRSLFSQRIPAERHCRNGGCLLNRWLPLTLFVLLFTAAVTTIIAGVLTGQLGLAVVFIFPVIYGSGPFAVIAVILIFAAFAALLPLLMTFPEYRNGDTRDFFNRQNVSTVQPPDHEEFSRNEAAPRRTGRFGGVIFIGPVPIIFGSDTKILRYMFAAAGIMAALILILFLFGIF